MERYSIKTLEFSRPTSPSPPRKSCFSLSTNDNSKSAVRAEKKLDLAVLPYVAKIRLKPNIKLSNFIVNFNDYFLTVKQNSFKNSDLSSGPSQQKRSKKKNKSVNYNKKYFRYKYESIGVEGKTISITTRYATPDKKLSRKTKQKIDLI